jgi:hypothetical protein
LHAGITLVVSRAFATVKSSVDVSEGTGLASASDCSRTTTGRGSGDVEWLRVDRNVER